MPTESVLREHVCSSRPYLSRRFHSISQGKHQHPVCLAQLTKSFDQRRFVGRQGISPAPLPGQNEQDVNPGAGNGVQVIPAKLALRRLIKALLLTVGSDERGEVALRHSQPLSLTP